MMYPILDLVDYDQTAPCVEEIHEEAKKPHDTATHSLYGKQVRISNVSP